MILPIIDPSNSNAAFHVIASYTRRDALEDGQIVDVSETAREAGIKWPVAFTCGLFESLTPTPTERDHGQSLKGRMWDALNLARFAIRAGAGAGDRFRTHIIVARKKKSGPGLKKTKLIYDVVIAPDDDGAPALTFLLPGED